MKTPNERKITEESLVFSVLFVCTGNICRSPTAEGVFRSLVEKEGLAGTVTADSAGTHGYHIGEAPDPRTIAAARRRGVILDQLRARQVKPVDFERFDLVLAMDRGHYSLMRPMVPQGRENRLRMFMDFAPELGVIDVPDPYYGQGDGFERVLDLTEAACRGLLAHIRSELG